MIGTVCQQMMLKKFFYFKDSAVERAGWHDVNVILISIYKIINFFKKSLPSWKKMMYNCERCVVRMCLNCENGGIC